MGDFGESVSGFYGRYETTMDDKGRFALPAKLRSVTDSAKNPLLDGNVILTKGLDGCLALYPEPEWQDIQSRLAGLSFNKKDFRYFSRRFYPSANLIVPDKNGRILIPSHLVSDAGLKRDLLVIGVNRWVEVWNPERYDYFLEQFKGNFEEVAERLFSGDGDIRTE